MKQAYFPIRYTDDFHVEDNYKWSIVNQTKADELHIETAELDEDTNILLVDMTFKPNDMSSDEYLDYIQSHKIAVNKIKKTTNKTSKNKLMRN